MPGGTKIVSG